jgi:glutaredoxin
MRPVSGASERAPVREITLYSRPGCHLCDEARTVLERIRAELPFTLVERDIETDDVLFKAYLERIPVIALDGEELFDFFVDEAELRRRLAYTGQR